MHCNVIQNQTKMPKRARKKLHGTTLNGPRFNIEERYNELNEAKKLLLRDQFMSSFGLAKRTFYLVLKRDTLEDDILQFFADMFGCGIKDLYREQPTLKPTIHDLARKAKGPVQGKQMGLDVQ